MKKMVTMVAWLFIVFLATGGCSKEQEAPPEGGVKKMTDATAEKIEQKIKTPLDKARATKGLGDQRTEAIDEATEKQPGK